MGPVEMNQMQPEGWVAQFLLIYVVYKGKF